MVASSAKGEGGRMVDEGGRRKEREKGTAGNRREESEKEKEEDGEWKRRGLPPIVGPH